VLSGCFFIGESIVKHYKLTDKPIKVGSRKLYRIQATVDLPKYYIKAGDLGGFVESYENLSGNAWVSDNAVVYGNARVYGNALVSGNSWVYGNAHVFENATVEDNARVYGNAWVYGKARIQDYAKVCGYSKVYGHTYVDNIQEIYNIVVKENTYRAVTTWDKKNRHIHEQEKD